MTYTYHTPREEAKKKKEEKSKLNIMFKPQKVIDNKESQWKTQPSKQHQKE